MSKQMTHCEGGKFYAIITLPNGHTYYSGPKNSRSTAYRYARRENDRHNRAAHRGMTYNTKGL